MVRLLSVPGLVALALWLSACNGDDAPADREPSSTAATTPSTGTTLPPAPPTDALETAQAGFRDAGAAQWQLAITTGDGTPVVAETGQFHVEPPASLSVRNARAERPRDLVTISQQTDVWFRSGTAPDLNGCWAHRGLDPQSPTSDLVPPSIQLLFARGLEVGATATAIDAAMPLHEAAKPFGETVQQMLLGLGQGFGNVPVRFTVQDGTLTGYRIALDVLIAVAAAAGVDPFPGLAELDLVAELRLLEVGEPVTLGPPAPDEVVELGPRESIAKGLGRCGLV